MTGNDDKCVRCGAINKIISLKEDGEVVCSNCGLVYEDRMIVDENESRTFQDDNKDNKLKRVDIPNKPEDGNEFGIVLIIREKGKTKVIRRNPKLNKIQKNFGKINNLLSNASVLPNIIEEVKKYYAKLNKTMNMQGQKIEHIIIGIYYFILRKNKMAKTIKEIVQQFQTLTSNLTERKLKRVLTKINKESEKVKDENEIIDAEKNYIKKYLGGDEEKYEYRELTYKIVKNINESGLLEGKSPRTIAGISLLISYKLLSDNLYDKDGFYNMFSNKAALMKSFELIKNSLNRIIPNDYNWNISEELFP